MPVRYEPDGAIVVVTLDRPEVGNPIDRPTAEALADAFRRFDADRLYGSRKWRLSSLVVAARGTLTSGGGGSDKIDSVPFRGTGR